MAYEEKIGEIHDMLIDYMNETQASPILEKIKDLVQIGYEDGYSSGCKDTELEFEENDL